MLTPKPLKDPREANFPFSHLCLLFGRAAVNLVWMISSVLWPRLHLGPPLLPNLINATVADHKSISPDSTQRKPFVFSKTLHSSFAFSSLLPIV